LTDIAAILDKWRDLNAMLLVKMTSKPPNELLCTTLSEHEDFLAAQADISFS